MKLTRQPRSHYARNTKPADTGVDYALTPDESRDITVRYGTIKYCAIAQGWILPAGSKQADRIVRCEKKARHFALKLDELIRRNLSMTSLNSRLIVYGG